MFIRKDTADPTWFAHIEAVIHSRTLDFWSQDLFSSFVYVLLGVKQMGSSQPCKRVSAQPFSLTKAVRNAFFT